MADREQPYASDRKPTDFLSVFSIDAALEPEAIREQAVRISNSDAFVRSARIQKLLNYLVESVLNGQQDRLKESIIGIDVFERPTDFDPKIDSIVRVEMRRIRSKLSEYYLSEGQADQVLIWLGKGSYVPVLGTRKAKELGPSSVPPLSELSTTLVEKPPELPPATITPVVSFPAELAPVRSSERRSKWIAFIAAAVLAIGVLLFYAGPTRHGIVSGEFTPEPLANELGMASTPSFSPNGQQIAFAWNGEKQDNFDIYIKMVGSPALVRLTSDSEIDYSPAWSPDGRLIAFCRGSATKGSSIWITSPLGGAERKVVEIRAPAIAGYRALTWTPDARALIYADYAPDEGTGALFVADVAGGKKRQLTFPPKNVVDMNPAYAPDGHAIAFARDTGRGVSAIHILTLRADGSSVGTPTQISWKGFERVMCSRPKWTPDSRELVFTSNRTGEHQLWAARPEGSATPRLFGSLGVNIDDCAISRDGTLALVRGSFGVNIWKLDLNALKKGMPLFPVRIVASTRMQTNPSVSPDGARIAFESNRSGFTEIWTANVDGSNAAPLTSMQNPITGSPTWSHDGTRIAFDSRVTGMPALYVVSSGGGSATVLTDKANRDVVPSWSNDDASIYFTSDRSGSSEIWKIPATGGKPQRMTHNGGFAAIASPDGSFLYYAADRAAATTLRRLNLKTGEETRIALGVLSRKYFPVNAGLYYMSGDPYHNQSLMFYATDSGKSELIAKLDRPIDKGFSVSPDGAQLYYGQIDNDGSDLMLVNKFWQ